MNSHKNIDLTSDQIKLKNLLDLDNYKEAEELLKEKRLDPNFIVQEYADIGHYTREDRYDHIPLIFFSKSREAISLLLKYGANPYHNASYTEYTYEGDVSVNGVCSILGYWACHESYQMIITLLKNQIFISQNNQINEAILVILKRLSFDPKKNDCLESLKLLIQSSTDLREIANNFQHYREHYSPFSFALNEFQYKYYSIEKKNVGMSLLLNNNFQLAKDLNSTPYFSWYEFQKKEEFDKHYQVANIQKFFDSIVTFQLLQLAMIDGNSKLNGLPLDVLRIILGNIIATNININITFDMYPLLYQNTRLITKMHTFNRIYSSLKNEEPWYTCHDFVEKHQHLYPITFFAKARQHQAMNPNGLTARTLAFSYDA